MNHPKDDKPVPLEVYTSKEQADNALHEFAERLTEWGVTQSYRVKVDRMEPRRNSNWGVWLVRH
jgi:hypothetical protein